MDLTELLHPIAPAKFFEERWEREPVLLRGAPGRFSGLFSSKDIGRLLTYGRTRPIDGVLLVKEGRHRDENWIGEGGAPRLEKIEEAWRDGYTLVVNDLQKLWEPVALLAAALEGELNHAVGINLYLTPPGSQGFKAHFDVTDAFILQLEGSKRWRVRGPWVDRPLLDEHRSTPLEGLPPILLEDTLERGGVLYVPRGFVHEAMTTELGSAHLTVGLRLVTWIELFSAALSAAGSDTRLRSALPPGFLSSPLGMEEAFRELLDGLPGRLSLRDALNQLAERLIVQRPSPPAGDLLARTAEIRGDSVLARRAGVSCRLLNSPGVAGLQYSGGRIVGPVRIGPALEHVVRSRVFSVRSLPGLRDEERLVLARRLVRAGVLVVQEST